VWIRAWEYDVIGVDGDIVPVYLLDTNVTENSEGDRHWTDSLYGGDERYRLCQEIILGLGGFELLRKLGHDRIQAYHMNEGHSALLALGLLERRLDQSFAGRVKQIDIDGIRAKTVVPPADVERTYNNSIEQYTTPEQVRASHILLKTEGKDDAAVKAKAEEVLKQAKAGADFAELAKKHSEDEQSAKNGGDLDYFGRGRMVPEFDQAVFAMQPNQTSDLVKTQYGYHIIKLVDKKVATTKPLAEVRQQITDQLGYERAQAQAADLAQKLEKQISRPGDLDSVAKANKLAVQESGFFARDEPILGLGPAPEATNKAFEMKPGEVSGALRASRGFVIETLVSKQDPYVPKLDEVKERVRDEVIKQKARDASKQKAAEIAAKLKAAPDFEKAAKAAGLEAKTTELISRDSPIPDLGVAPAVEEAAFKMPVGGVSEAIATDNGTAVIKVIEKKEVTPDEWKTAKERFREELLSDRRNRFFGSYMAKAKKGMKIDVNRETLQRAIG